MSQMTPPHRTRYMFGHLSKLMATISSADDLYFDGLTLRLKTGRILAVVVPDGKMG